MKSKGLNAFQLKLLMAFLMVFDHIGMIPGLLPAGWDGILHLLTRCVGVWFGYMAVEGFIHTRSRPAYCLRLFFWAGLMLVGNTLLNLLLQSRQVELYHNIFLTLGLGVLMLGLFYGFSENGRAVTGWKKGLRLAAGILVLLAGSFLTEGGMTILPFMLISYSCRDKKPLRNLLYLALSVLLFALNIQIYPTLSDTISMMLYNSDWFFISVLPLLYLYNGQRGSSSKGSKYFFYIFYPAHLWLIALLAFLLKG